MISNRSNKIIHFFILWLVLGMLPAQAQSLHTAISTQAKASEKLNLTALMSLRSYDMFDGLSKATLSLSANYTFSPYLSMAAGTALVMNHSHERELSSGETRPMFWQPRWRTFISVSPKISFAGFNAFYRSRFQMLVKASHSLTLQPSGDPYEVEGETSFSWVHRLYIEHPFKKFTPYVSFDMFNSLDYHLEITQYQFAVGTYYFLNPRNRFGLFGRMIFRPDKSKPVDGLYVLGLTYQFRFSL